MNNPLDRCASCRERHVEHRRDGDRYLCQDGGDFKPWPPLCRDDEDPTEFERLTEKWRGIHDSEITGVEGCERSNQQTDSDKSRAELKPARSALTGDGL